MPTEGESCRQSCGTGSEEVAAVEHVTSCANNNNLMEYIRANSDCELCAPSRRNATYFLSSCLRWTLDQQRISMRKIHCVKCGRAEAGFDLMRWSGAPEDHAQDESCFRYLRRN